MRRPPGPGRTFRVPLAATAGACSTAGALPAVAAIACPRFREAHAAASAEQSAIPGATCGDRKRSGHRLKWGRGHRNGVFVRQDRRMRGPQEPPEISKRQKRAVLSMAATRAAALAAIEMLREPDALALAAAADGGLVEKQL
jgi:hypothetical protein